MVFTYHRQYPAIFISHCEEKAGVISEMNIREIFCFPNRNFISHKENRCCALLNWVPNAAWLSSLNSAKCVPSCFWSTAGLSCIVLHQGISKSTPLVSRKLLQSYLIDMILGIISKMRVFKATTNPRSVTLADRQLIDEVSRRAGVQGSLAKSQRRKPAIHPNSYALEFYFTVDI